MDSLSLTHEGTSSFPKSSKKRASSLDAPALPSKKPKADSGQVHSDKNKRRRKKKKEPIARDSSVSEPTHSSSLTPEHPFPSALNPAENHPSSLPSQPFCCPPA